MTSPSPEVRVPLTGIWLSAEPIQTPIDTLVIDTVSYTHLTLPTILRV